MGFLSKDEQDLLDDASKLIEKAGAARPDKAAPAWLKAAEYLDKQRAKMHDRRPEFADRYVAVGAGFQKIGDNANALTSWKKALDVHGRHVGAFQSLAEAFEAAGNPAEAARYFDEAVRGNPDSAPALAGKAQFLLRRSDRPGAAALYEKLHHLEPEEMKWVLELCELDAKNSKWWLARAKIAHKLKDGSGARMWSAKAAELAPGDPLPRVYTSLLLEEAGELRASLQAADEAVVLTPVHKEANRQRARLLSKLGDDEAALDAWKKMTRIAPDDSRGWIETAGLLVRKGKFEEASLHYDTACKLAPTDAALWVTNAGVKEKLGRTGEALAALEGAERAGGADAPLLKRKAAVLLKLGRAEPSLEAAARASRLDPHDREAYERQIDALASIQPRRNEAFIAAANEVLRLAPQSERASIEKSKSLANLAKWKDSREAADLGLRQNTGSLALWRLKVAAHKSLGEHEEVAAAADSILHIDPKDAQAGLDRGEALFELQRFPEALEAYNALLKVDPTHLFAGTRRGQCLQKTNHHREAVEAFDKVLKRDKENVLAHRLKAESLAALGQHREAITEMDIAIGVDPRNVKLWLFKASLHQQAGEVDAAKRCFAKALDVDPKNLEALASRASLLLSRGQAKEALVDLEVLTAAHADHAPGWLLLAEALESVGQLDAARNAIGRSLKLNERDVVALRQGASLEIRAGRPAEAAVFLERAVAVDDKDLNTMLDLGEAYEAAGQLDDALRAFERSAVILPGDRDIAGLIKSTLRKLNRDAEVERICAELLRADPKDADALFDLALARRNQGNLEGALESARQLVALRPKDVPSLNELGIIHSELGRHQDAVDTFSRALEVDPKAEHALVNKALALRRLGEHREALACLREAVDINPNEPANWNLLGLTYSALDMHSKSLEAYDRGLALAPAHPLLLNNKGKALVDTNDLEGAVGCFRGATEANPRDEKAHLNLGIALARLNRVDDAEAALERARELNPGSQDVLNNLARVKMSKRNFAGALAVLDAVVKEGAQNRPAWVNRGICLDNLDRFEEAIVSYRRAVDLDPSDYLTWHNMGLAYYSLKRHDDALPCFDKAHKLNPEHQASLEKRSECAEIIKEREVERYARKIVDFEFTHGKPPTREEAFRVAGVPLQHLDDAMAYLGGEVRLDLMGISKEELHDLEKASAAVLKWMMTPEAAMRGDPINLTLADFLHHFDQTSIRRAKKILKYIAEVDRLRIDPKKTVTPELEKAVQQAVLIPPERRNIREVSVTLNAGILRSKRVLQILRSLEKELDIPAHEVTIRSIKEAGWKVRDADDDLEEEEDTARRGKRKVREEEPEFVVDLKTTEPVHAAPSFAREFSQYAGAPAPDAVTGPPAARPRVYCSSCKIRGASYRHNECGEFLCDVCVERFNQVEHLTAGIRLLCPVCEKPIRDLTESVAKWDRM